ncbi:MAG: hypothetical protein LBR08_10735 [Bacteroidales bacterium]|jgi:hypothetical protein|nr:hypothetical protein [Bacteroidales bacterium]
MAVWLAAADAYSQTPKQFGEDIDQYPQVVANMFRAVKTTEEEKAFTERFSEIWQGNMFDADEKTRIVKLSDFFLAKKARNIHYFALWRCLLLFKEPANSSKGYSAWMKALHETCSDKRSTPTSVQALMNATEQLLARRTVCSGAGSEWRTDTDDFWFDDSDGTLSVVFGSGNLYCLSKGDSIAIEQTAGRYDMTEQKWTGVGGTVTWERAGFAPEDVFAKLGKYVIDMKKSQYEADSVMFLHKTYFPQPVQGKLIDRARADQNPGTALFPEFHTYGERYVFENIYPDISYEGGIAVHGARLSGLGTDEEKALLRITKGDSLKFFIRSKNFIFRTDRINAQNASPVIYFGEDSIVHVNLSFVYLVATREVNFTRSDAASSQASYNNSYHKVDMNFEQLVWKLDEPSISFSITRGASIGRAEFKSQDFFQREQFEQMQYFDKAHPLIQLKKCAEAFGVAEFPLEVYAGFIKGQIADTRNRIIHLAKQGFVAYDGDNDYIAVQPVLFNYLEAAAKKKDYDVINLQSLVNAPEKNAVMDVGTYDMDIYGVDRIVISDSQRVVIVPDNRTLTLQKNRAINIDGAVGAGQLVLYGDSMHFDYDDFKINFHRIDSMIIYVPSGEKDGLGKDKMKKVQNVIQTLSGNLLVDRPDNKSGRFSLHEYPVLNSDSASYVYYGSTNIEGGSYNNERFYFEVDPFILDSVEHFAKNRVVLPGRFASADIFDDMRQELVVQPDYSLGFVYETGDEAIATYGDARLQATVTLSNKGLRAKGQLNFLTASIHTDEFKFYPDSMNVLKAKEFVLRKQTAAEGTEYPEVHSEGNRIHWQPHNDKMYIYKADKTFGIYNQNTEFDGTLLLAKTGLSGKGRLDMKTADVRSEDIDFRTEAFRADTSLFRLRAAENAPYRLVTVDSVRSEIDFPARKGQFAAIREYALVNFPENRFAAYMDRFDWDMEKATVRIGGDTALHPLKEAKDFKYKIPGEGKGIRYYSTARTADSLNFVASSAIFDYAGGQIKAEGVKLVKTANALVFPFEEKLTVTSDGLLNMEENALIVFNDTLQQHRIHSAKVNITGRNSFTGSGKYDYTDETEKVTVVEMTGVVPDKTGKVTAGGSVAEKDSFMLSPFYRFQGKISLSSEKQYPEFDGVAQIVQECEMLTPDWFKFASEVNPGDVKIKVDEAPVNRQNAKIYNGIFIAGDSVHIYPAFFSKRRHYADKPLIQAQGVLSYNRDSMIYYIATEEKLQNRDTLGNLLAYNRNSCVISGEGRISLGADLGRVTAEAAGRVVHNMYTKETSMDVMLALDFLFDDALAADMVAKIDSMPNLAGVDITRRQYVRNTNEWLGMARARAYRNEAALGKVKALPEELNRTLMITQLNLQWNQARRSYRSTGKIGVGNIMGHQLNRMVDGLVEITKRQGGDVLDVYLKIDDGKWFYFNYAREVMQVISSDMNFNNRLMTIPEKLRKSEERRPGYTYMIASVDKLSEFLLQMNRRAAVEEQEKNPLIPVEPAPEETPEEAPVVEIE